MPTALTENLRRDELETLRLLSGEYRKYPRGASLKVLRLVETNGLGAVARDSGARTVVLQ